MSVDTAEQEYLLLAEAYKGSNPEMVAFLMEEVRKMRRECSRARIRCRQCVWAWHLTGEFAWRCVRCTAGKAKL